MLGCGDVVVTHDRKFRWHFDSVRARGIEDAEGLDIAHHYNTGRAPSTGQQLIQGPPATLNAAFSLDYANRAVTRTQPARG